MTMPGSGGFLLSGTTVASGESSTGDSFAFPPPVWKTINKSYKNDNSQCSVLFQPPPCAHRLTPAAELPYNASSPLLVLDVQEEALPLLQTKSLRRDFEWRYCPVTTCDSWHRVMAWNQVKDFYEVCVRVCHSICHENLVSVLTCEQDL